LKYPTTKQEILKEVYDLLALFESAPGRSLRPYGGI